MATRKTTILLPHYKTRRHQRNGQRFYLADGGEFPSVTTILSATESEDNRARLRAWQERTPNHEHIRDLAAKRGTRLHQRLEDHLLGNEQTSLLGALLEPSPEDVEHEKLWDALQPFIESIEEVALLEAPLWWRSEDGRLGYAGAVDLVARLKGEDGWSICDLKTCTKPKPQKTWWGKAFCQLAAYSQAAEQVYVSHGLVIDKALVVSVDVQKFKLYPHACIGEEFETYGEVWNDRLELFTEQREQAEKALELV